VFLDGNSNGAFDAGETSTTSAANGAWSLTGVGPGTHRVSLLNPGGWAYTTDSFFDVFMSSGGNEARSFGANRTPTVVNDSFGGAEDNPIGIDVSTNDVDPDGPGYTVEILSGPSNGSLTPLTGGQFTYTPTANFNGADSFTYRVSDGVSQSGSATVSLTVNPVNDLPTADSVTTQSVNEGQSVNLTVVGHDVDVGDSLTYSMVSGPGSIDANSGAYSYLAVDGDSYHSARVRVSDGHVDSFFDVFFDISVHNVAPTLAVTGAGTAQIGVAYNLDLSASDPGDDTLTGWSIAWGDGSFSNPSGDATSASHVYTTAGNYSILASATDEDDSYVVNGPTVSVSSGAVNHAPSADPIAAQNVNEGLNVNLTVVGHDEDGDPLSYSLLSGPGSIDPDSGAYSFHALDGFATHNIAVRVSDGMAPDSFFDVFFDITVHNVAPTLAISGPATGSEGQVYTLNLSSSDPGADSLSAWSIDWGDGNSSNAAGNASSASHVYAASGNFTISATATDEDGTWNANSLGVAIDPMSFRVTGFSQNDSGFHLDFNRAADGSVLNLYSAADAPMGEADLVLSRAGDLYPVRGSLILDSDRQGATFIKSNGVLEAGNYSLTLASRNDGWKDSAGRLLDGNGDGTAGDPYSHSFTVAAGSRALLSIGEILVGPDQTLNIPAATGIGLPISLSNAAGLTSASFKLAYDPTLFTLTGIDFVTGSGSYSIANGIVSVSLTTPALGSGTVELVRLRGKVPDTAPYGAKQVLDLHDVLLNSGAMPAQVDDGLHLAAFIADTSGNGGYAALDQTRMQRVIGLQDSGFSSYPLVDPVLIADVNNSKGLNSADVLLLARELKYLSNTTAYATLNRPEIPAITTAPTVFSGAAPLINLPGNLTATAGGLVSVPALLAELEVGLTSIALDSATLDIAWDPSQLELVSVGRGSLTGDFDLFNATPGHGTLHIDMSRTSGLLDVGLGSLAELQFRVAAGASGSLAIDLVQAQLNETRLTLNPAPKPGADPTDGLVRVNLPLAPEPLATPDLPLTPQALGAAPVIDFGSRYDGYEFKASGEKGWLGDWLTDGKDKKPNLEALRIQPIVQAKVASRLSARL